MVNSLAFLLHLLLCAANNTETHSVPFVCLKEERRMKETMVIERRTLSKGSAKIKKKKDWNEWKSHFRFILFDKYYLLFAGSAIDINFGRTFCSLLFYNCLLVMVTRYVVLLYFKALAAQIEEHLLVFKAWLFITVCWALILKRSYILY